MVGALGALLLLLFGVLPASAAAETFTVNTTVDSSGIPGEEVCTGAVGITCTLREAIGKANGSAGEDTISFAGIAAGSVLQIEESSLPTIDQKVTLDGHTAAGATTTAPAVELLPVDMGEESFTTGFAVHEGTGTRIEGFAIGGFSAGIEVAFSEGTEAVGTEICGNYLGTDLSGELAEPNITGAEVWAMGTAEQPQGTVIGSPSAGCAGNAIAGNSSFGVADHGLETTVSGNSIGIGPQPSGQVLPNGTPGKAGSESAGVYVAALAAGTMIGGSDLSGLVGNVIFRNAGPGVFVEAAAKAVTIRRNSFSENEGLGIEIAGGGPAVPTLTSARSSGPTTLEVAGSVEGEVDGETVAIEVFGNPACDSSGSGEGQTYLGRGSFQVEPGPNPYAFSLAVAVPADDTAITVTATRESGATTEFSSCATYEPPPQTFVVTTTADSSHEGVCGATCSLRDAIEAANATPTKDTIDFNVAGKIEPEVFTLPAISAPVTIDGTSAPGFAGVPVVELDGSSVTASGIDGLVVRTGGSGSTIAGLAIGGFENGILFEGTGNQVCGSYLGVEADGATALANENGVETWSGSGGDLIGAGCGALGGGNLIAGNSGFGILDRGHETRIAANRIGIDAAGGPLANGGGDGRGGGIEESLEASGGTIGRVDGEAANVIGSNDGPGIVVDRSSSAIEIRGNSIFGNTGLGIEIETEPPVAPTVAGVTVADGTLTFEGVATAGPSEEGIALDFFANESCDSSGAGEGQVYLGESGQNSLGGPTSYETEPIAGTIPAGHYYITATSTGSVLGQTTEFSQCFHYVPPGETFVVDTLTDTSHGECAATCSLRDAIEAANELPNRDLIEFAAAAEGTIALGEQELPWLVEPVTIDGTLAPGWSTTSGPKVTIDGTATRSDGPTQGLLIEPAAQGSAISGVAIENFDLGAIVVANHVSFDSDRIAHNRGPGVRVTDSAPETSIRHTTLFADAGGSIEFETPNTVPEPEVEHFLPGSDSTVYFVPIQGMPDHHYAVDVFADAQCEPGGFGPAEVLLGSEEDVTTDESGEALAEVHGGTLTGIDAENLTATATDLATGTTSQIGNCTTTQPETEIESGPTGVTPSTSATFTFSGFSYGRIVGYECSLDGTAFTACASPQQYTGLAAGEHTFRVRSVTSEGARDPEPPSTTWTVEAAQPGPPEEEKKAPDQGPPPATPPVTSTVVPTNGETIVVRPEEGKVKIKLPGTNKYVPLEELKEIPVGAVIDATKGRVTLTSIDPDGTEQTAEFFGGVFKVKQKEGAGLVVLELLDTGVCPAPRSSARAATSLLPGTTPLLARAGKGTSGKLWGSGHGNFKTEGNQGSATVRGTIWLVEDRCNGTTFFKTRRGVVSVRDFVLHKTLSVPAGKSYVAGSG